MRILVAGLGAMGLPMARALVAGGFDVAGYDPVARPADLRCVAHPDDAAADALAIVVRDAAEVAALCFDDESLFAAAPYPSRVMLCSTVSVGAVRALRARLPAGVALVDAPMSGAPVAAEERSLSFMLGGTDADVDALLPLVRAMGSTHHRLGPLGAGMRVKVLNNSVAAASVVAVRRALAEAARAGIDRSVLLDVMRVSSGATWFGDAFERVSWAREGYAPDNTMGILVKDVRAGIESAGREPDGWDAALVETLRSLTPMASATPATSAPDAPTPAPSPGSRPALVVAPERLDRADLFEMVRAHREDLARHSPACSVHALAPDAFGDPDLVLLAAREGDELVGCGAVRFHGDGLAELKTMRAATTHARRGVGTALLEALLGEARTRGATRVALETGTGSAFEPALAFYARHGFERCGPFADYAKDPFSTFMARELDRDASSLRPREDGDEVTGPDLPRGLWTAGRSGTELRAPYDGWADRYDADMAAAGMLGPRRLLAMLLDRVGDGRGAVLDFGCGTGAMGPLLRDAGFGPIRGTDLSVAMLRRAEATGAYDALDLVEPGAPVSISSGTDAVTASGSICIGAGPPGLLGEVVEAMSPGAVLALSYNDDTLRDEGYMAALAKVQVVGRARLEAAAHGPQLPALGRGATAYALRRL